MKIVFMGTPDFAVQFLDSIQNEPSFELVGIVSQPDRPSGRGRKLTAPAVAQKATELGINLFQPEDLKSDEFYNDLAKLEADLFVLVAYSILPERIVNLPKFGSINVHTSLLPKYRGAAPIQHAVLNGDSLTGISIFKLDKKMDHGPLLAQLEIPIEYTDTSLSIFEKFEDKGPGFLISTLHKYKEGKSVLVEQDHTLACGAPKLKKEMGKLDFTLDAEKLHNLIRGMFPWPGTYCELNNKKFKVTVALPDTTRACNKAPGTLDLFEKKLFVACKNYWLELIQVQLEGKKPVSGADFARGAQNFSTLVLK
ncbi:methionyl-tRNA formyltransferase [Fibrobacterales bacterium]|nr:methionyl-tRNA formyltransferase [Fibrobacterales bacterium]